MLTGKYVPVLDQQRRITHEHINRNYERELIKMMMNILPQITASDGYKGRVLIQKALTEYFASKYDTEEDVPKFTKDRMELEREFGMTPSEMAGLEVAVMHVALSNTIPTAFWMLVHVFSRPKLVEMLRIEANGVIAETGRSDQGQREVTIDIVRLEEKCPLLFSTLRETQRVISIAVLNRRVMADTIISDDSNSYLLKKGNLLQISHGVTHNMEEVWGPSVHEFNAERFLKTADRLSTVKSEDDLAIKPGAYTPFGAGKHICPGRFFASGEILGFMLPLLLGFEIVDSKDGPIRVPAAATPWITTALGKPVSGSDLNAVIRRRAGWEDVQWRVDR
jgi:cytochrome P450